MLSATKRENGTFSPVWSYFSPFFVSERQQILVDPYVFDHGEFDGAIHFVESEWSRILDFSQNKMALTNVVTLLTYIEVSCIWLLS